METDKKSNAFKRKKNRIFNFKKKESVSASSIASVAPRHIKVADFAVVNNFLKKIKKKKSFSFFLVKTTRVETFFKSCSYNKW